MSKQDEIREGMERAVVEFAFNEPYEGLPTREKTSARNWVTARLRELHDNGVAIKVDRELPTVIDEFGNFKLGGQILDEMLKAGYVAVEPLTEEVKDEQ